jgi:hypothetical protein
MIAPVSIPTGPDLTAPGLDAHAAIRSPFARVCIWATLTVAPLCAVVGLFAAIGIGTVSLLNVALIAGSVTGGVTFVLLVIWFLGNRRLFNRRSLVRMPSPYQWIAIACAIGSFVVAIASLATGHDGKAFVCAGAQYCRVINGDTMRITRVAYMQNQGPGAIFLALWCGVVATTALAASRGVVTLRVLGTGRSRWFPGRSH